MSNLRSGRWERAALLVILLAAAFLRLHQLGAVPPGLTHDEAGHAHDAQAILDGARPLYQTVGYGREPLFDYLLAAWQGAAGVSGMALRLLPAYASLLFLSLTFRWVRSAFGRPVALLTVALLAVSFWPLATGRQLLRSGLLPLFFSGAVLGFWRLSEGRRPRPGSLLLFVLCLAAAIYTYIPARILWLVFPLVLVPVWLAGRERARRVAGPLVLGLLATAALVAPMFLYLRAHPGAEQRLGMLDAPLQALRAGDWNVLLGRAADMLAAWVLPGRGDHFLAYTVPGRPFFDPLTGALLAAGMLICLRRWRNPACSLALVWFWVGIAPSLVTGPDASYTRSIAAMPAAYLFPAVALAELVARLPAELARRPWPAVAAAILLAVTAGFTYRDYFVRWGQSADVRAAYRNNLLASVRWARDELGPGTAIFSTDYPLEPHDPYLGQLYLPADRLMARWVDGRGALLLPAAGDTWLVLPASTPPDPFLAALPGVEHWQRVALRPDDLNPHFDVYRVDPAAARDALAEAALPWQTLTDPPLPADFGPLRLLGIVLLTPTAPAGGELALATIWQVEARPEGELVLFAHALGPAGELLGQQDRLDAPNWDWQLGDWVIQVHRVAMPAGFSGSAAVEVGAYRRQDLVRLPLAAGGDRVLLAPLEVGP